MNLQVEHSTVNAVWKWLVIHDDINAHVQPNRYRYLSQMCAVLFGPEDTGWVTGVWTAGKMGWKFRSEYHANEFTRMVAIMSTVE